MTIDKMENETLRRVITQYTNLVVIYTSQSCQPCIDLFLKLAKIAGEKKYRHFYFLEIDAKENPVAERAVEAYRTPLVTVYRNGLVIESKTVKSEEAFRLLLETSI